MLSGPWSRPTFSWVPWSAPCSRGPAGSLDAKLLRVLGVQSLPAVELQRVAGNDAANGISAEQPVQDIEADVPPGSTHGDVTAIDVGPQRQPCAAIQCLEFPPHLKAAPVVFERLGGLGSRHRGFADVRGRR